MAFQDFDQITERRRVSNSQKFRRRVLISVASGVALLAIVCVGGFALASRFSHHDPAGKPMSELEGQAGNKAPENVVRVICNATDYKERCVSALSRVSGAGSPKDLVSAAIAGARSELQSAFEKSRLWKFASPEEKGAFEDCEVLVGDALEELETAVSTVAAGAVGGVPAKKSELDSWLSAVISYQQTCVDGFPEGKTKADMARLFKASKEFTSNSLALVSELSSIFSAFQLSDVVPSRHLLQAAPVPTPVPTPAPAKVVTTPVPAPAPKPVAEAPVPAPEVSPTPETEPLLVPHGFNDLGFPEWMEEDDRRILKVPGEKPTPNAVVAQDGSGNFKTINEAVKAIPLSSNTRYVIYVKAGVYDENVILTKKMWNVTIYGDGSQKTIITGKRSYVDGFRTFQTASFAAVGDGFIGIGMGFHNTAGPAKHQAVAARFQSDRAVLFNCRFEAYQDTLFAQAHRQLYRSCVIIGTIDFIFGDAAAVFQNCLMALRRPMDNQQNIVTAQGRSDRRQSSGFVLQRCRIIADRTLETGPPVKCYLGRPWKEFSRTVVMETVIHDVIDPAGWLPWFGSFALDTLYYAEYANSGPSSGLASRVKWPGYKGALSKADAEQYTIGSFLQGQTWLNDVKGVPFLSTLYGS